MKHIYKWFFCILLVSCSSNDNNLLDDITVRGGFIEFEDVPEALNFNFLKLEDFNINSELIDGNNNAASYSLTLIHDANEVPDFIVINSFPATLSIDMPSIVNALGITMADVNDTSEFRFLASVTTPEDVYSGLNPDFNSETNENEGGNSVSRLIQSTTKQAMDFTLRFFVPPPKKLRGTSFEEPFASADPAADYIRLDGEGETDEGELFNHLGERHVMHIATGSGEDDEIGFKSFFVDNGGNGFANEEIGVTQKIEDVLSYPDGIQGFQVEDIDGLWRLVFDKVTIDNSTDPLTGVQIKFFPRDATWEGTDTIHIYAELEKVGGTTETIELLDLSGSDIESIHGKWNTVSSGFLDNVISYTLTIDSELNQPSEEFYFDEMLVFVPEE